MRENTLGLTAVLASGEVVTTGGRARKSSAGYDLTRLLIGSEGTLGMRAAPVRMHGPAVTAEARSALWRPYRPQERGVPRSGEPDNPRSPNRWSNNAKADQEHDVVKYLGRGHATQWRRPQCPK